MTSAVPSVQVLDPKKENQPVFDINQSGAILGQVRSSRHVPRPTQGLVGSEPDLSAVGLDGLRVYRRQPSRHPKPASPLLESSPPACTEWIMYALHVLSSRKDYSFRAFTCSSNLMRTLSGLAVVNM